MITLMVIMSGCTELMTMLESVSGPFLQSVYGGTED
jgi:uncharacterized protein YceK